MVLGMALSTFTRVHVIISLIAIVSGQLVQLGVLALLLWLAVGAVRRFRYTL